MQTTDLAAEYERYWTLLGEAEERRICAEDARARREIERDRQARDQATESDSSGFPDQLFDRSK
jgi:hypothetical protein